MPRPKKIVAEKSIESKDKCPVCGKSLNSFVVAGDKRYCSDACVKKVYK